MPRRTARDHDLAMSPRPVLDAEQELPNGILPPTSRQAPAPDVADTEIVARILDGDPDAFGDLVARYHRRAFWVAFHVVGRAEDARDVVQEAFVRLHRSLHSYDLGRNFYTWFYRIVTNLAIDALRKRRSARAVEIDGLDEWLEGGVRPHEPLEQDETRRRVWQVLDELDEKYRAVLVLRELHGMSCREIAPVLGVTHATARWRLHRGRQVFRDGWERIARLEGLFAAGDAAPDGSGQAGQAFQEDGG